LYLAPESGLTVIKRFLAWLAFHPEAVSVEECAATTGNYRIFGELLQWRTNAREARIAV
jgi:hypothetical protein